MNEVSLRTALYQFIGSVLISYNNPEQAISIILEEITKVISKEGDAKDFDNKTVKPLIKAASFIISQRHDKLLEDSKKAFGDNTPKQINDSLNKDKELVEALQDYIKRLGE